MSLVIKNEDHYNKVLDLVKTYDEKHKLNLMEKLEDQLDYLRNYGNGDYTVELDWDFSPLSFSVIWFRDGKYVMCGGLIFHNGVGFKDGTLAVDLSHEEGPYWSVHT